MTVFVALNFLLMILKIILKIIILKIEFFCIMSKVLSQFYPTALFQYSLYRKKPVENNGLFKITLLSLHSFWAHFSAVATLFGNSSDISTGNQMVSSAVSDEF